MNREGDTLVIRIPIGKPTPSASGKTLVVASTRGSQKTGVRIDGKDHVSVQSERLSLREVSQWRWDDTWSTGWYVRDAARVRHAEDLAEA